MTPSTQLQATQLQGVFWLQKSECNSEADSFRKLPKKQADKQQTQQNTLFWVFVALWGSLKIFLNIKTKLASLFEHAEQFIWSKPVEDNL